jgi:hypothetical protein
MLTMNWQIAAVLVVLAVAVLYLAHSGWRMLTGKKTGCGGSCRCEGKTSAGTQAGEQVTHVPLEQVTLRRREQNPS